MRVILTLSLASNFWLDWRNYDTNSKYKCCRHTLDWQIISRNFFLVCRLQKYKTLLTSVTKNIANFYKVQQRKPPKPTVTFSFPTLQLWLQEVGNSKNVYERKVRVNRYLNSMKENSEIEECAICMSFVVTVIENFSFFNFGFLNVLMSSGRQ